MSQDKNQLILDVKNLVVRYETEDGVVSALQAMKDAGRYPQKLW